MIKNKSDKPYFVLYKRDVETEKNKKYENRQLYDRMNYFTNEQDAKIFAFNNLPARLAQNASYAQITPNQEYLICAEYHGKYQSCCMGECDSMTTLDVVTAKQNNIQNTIEALVQEKYCEGIVAVGLELKLF